MSAQPAKAGEREQVAEAVELQKLLEHKIEIVDAVWQDVVLDVKTTTAILTCLSALAEARSEVGRARTNAAQEAVLLRTEIVMLRHDKRAAEAERDTLAAQLVGAREALERIERTTFDGVRSGLAERSLDRREVWQLARQALSMSILRGHKGCSPGEGVKPSDGAE